MKNYRARPKGWRNDSVRHSLASKGIKTKTQRSMKTKLPPIKLVDEKTFSQQYQRLKDSNDPQNPEEVLAFFNENENVIFLSPRRNTRSIPHELGHVIFIKLNPTQIHEFATLQKIQDADMDTINETFAQKFAEFVVEPKNTTKKEQEFFQSMDNIPGMKDGSLTIKFN